MRILMLGNSLTRANNLAQIISERMGAQVVAHTRSGARLAEQLNPNTKMGSQTQRALINEVWDYVVLQEMSNAAITSENCFSKSVDALCVQAKAAGAIPIIFATWAYRKDSPKLIKMGITEDEMAQRMSNVFRQAAERNDALLAPVGDCFYADEKKESLYAADGIHPSERGSQLAAETICKVIAETMHGTGLVL